MPHDYSDDRLRLAARLYYMDGLGQNEVAAFVKVSQAKVSRLLALARERGIVRITVADYEPRRHDLEGALVKQYGLDTAIVIKAIDGLGSDSLRRAVGHFAAAPFEAMIGPKAIVALSGGRTIHELVNHLPEPRNRALTVVQTMGSVDANLSAVDAQEVGRIMAHRLGGTFLTLNAPAYLPDRQTREALFKLAQVKNVFEHLRRADLAIIGVGTLENSVFVERGVFRAEDMRTLRQAGAVGEVCGRFINAAGEECETEFKHRVMSAEIATLRRVRRLCGVVSGRDRTEAIRAAIAGRLLNCLIIDEAGANALLEEGPAKATAKSRDRKRT